MSSDDSIPRILFVCVANSARSQIAEGLMRDMARKKDLDVLVESCGTDVGKDVQPLAIEVMREIGIDISQHRTKHITAVHPADYIVSVCETEATTCPVPDVEDAVAVNWRIPDPVELMKALKNKDEQMLSFRQTRESLQWRIEKFLDCIETEGWDGFTQSQKAEDLRKIHQDLVERDVLAFSKRLDDVRGIRPLWGESPCKTEKNLCLVLMPYSEQWSKDVWLLIKRVAKGCGLKCVKADQRVSPLVMKEIWKDICNAEVIIADITKQNPNVTYEVGLADALGRTVVLLSQDETPPFNFLGRRLIPYQDLSTLEKKLAKHITKVRSVGQ